MEKRDREDKGKEKEPPYKKQQKNPWPYDAADDETTDDSGEKELPPKKRYRLSAKTLALTYPQCPVPKEHALQQLATKLGPPQEYIVAQEHHQVYIYPDIPVSIYDDTATIAGSPGNQSDEEQDWTDLEALESQFILKHLLFFCQK